MESDFFCRCCGKRLESGNSRFSVQLLLIRAIEERYLDTLFEAESGQFQLDSFLEQSWNSAPEEKQEDFWSRFFFFTCFDCREGIIHIVEKNLQDDSENTTNHDFFIHFESIVGYDELQISEEDLQKDVQSELKETIKTLKKKDGEELRKEIWVSEKGYLSTEKMNKIKDYVLDLLKMGGKNQSVSPQRNGISVH